MNPQTDPISGLGLPQPANGMTPLPPIHTPQTFHAPDSPAAHFSASTATLPNAPTSSLPQAPGLQSVQAPVGAIQAASQTSAPTAQTTLNQINAMATTASQQTATQPEETDTPLDEEWVAKAHVVVNQTHSDPYVQSRELSKLKAQYVKARYNKDIKVSER